MLEISSYSSKILHDISFELNENLTILGANGAGKSTLAKVLCSIIPSKSVRVFSENLHEMSSKQRAEFINYIPPKLEMFDEYISVYEYLCLSKLYSGYDVDDVLELLDIEDIKDESCKTLSSGEQQLTLIASSILHNAKITIFDEPTANLDPKKTIKVYETLQSDKIQDRVVITHDLNLAFKLGYKILYICNGKMEFFESNEKFFKDENLQKIFGSALKRVDDHFMVNL